MGSTGYSAMYRMVEDFNISVNRENELRSPPSIRAPRPFAFEYDHLNMTGREDAPVSGVNVEQTYKNLENLHNNQVRGDMHRRQESAKQAKRIGQGAKSSKPTQQIYRPPNSNQKNGAKVHFEINTQTKAFPLTTEPTELKSALKRSKSFTNETTEIATYGFERDAFPLECQGLIKKAMSDPNSLSSQNLMELVRLICGKAVENAKYSVPAAQLCFCIMEKEHDHTFMESLLNCCREWYNERDKLLRSTFLSTLGPTLSGSGRWTAYVSFLTALYLQLKSQHCQMFQTQVLRSPSDVITPHPNSPMAHLALTLVSLLYECSFIILKPQSLNNAVEIECLRKMLMTVGKQLECDAPHRMQQVVSHLRDSFVNPSINAQIRKTILEVVELHASSWQLDLSQTMYYFPYTNFDRK